MYVLDTACISPQNTFYGNFFNSEIVRIAENAMMAIEPKYEEIPNKILRRLSSSIRMATGAGMPLLQKWPVDGIIIGTSDGGTSDCDQFLDQMMIYEEGTLTPTKFIQGAPSSIAGTLALMSKNSGYNNTHSDLGLTFESCLLDAMLMFDEGSVKQLLVGAVEEISNAQMRIELLALKIGRSAEDKEIFDQKVYGEGAAMFVLSKESDGAIAQIVDIGSICFPNSEELDSLTNRLLVRSNTNATSVDMVMIGSQSEKETALYYQPFIDRNFPNADIVNFKDLFGENPSASAFGTWLAVQVLKGESLPSEIVEGVLDRTPEHILIYNQFRGSQHGLILLRKV